MALPAKRGNPDGPLKNTYSATIENNLLARRIAGRRIPWALGTLQSMIRGRRPADIGRIKACELMLKAAGVVLTPTVPERPEMNPPASTRTIEMEPAQLSAFLRSSATEQ